MCLVVNMYFERERERDKFICNSMSSECNASNFSRKSLSFNDCQQLLLLKIGNCEIHLIVLNSRQNVFSCKHVL